MAGHSKWTNIRHKKARADTKRGKIFTKLIREIIVAARKGEDASMNPALRDAMIKAQSANMPKETITRAIKKGAGNSESDDLDSVRYEGYGPNGVAVMVDCLTNNRNRTVNEVRHAFTKSGGNLGTDGSVAYLFLEQGRLEFPVTQDEDKIMEVVLETEALDIQFEGDRVVLLTEVEQFSSVHEAMQAAGFESKCAQVTYVASTKVALDVETAEKFLRLIERLEELDDVQDVYSNAEMDDAILAQRSESSA